MSKKKFKGNEQIVTMIAVHYIQKCDRWKWLHSSLFFGER